MQLRLITIYRTAFKYVIDPDDLSLFAKRGDNGHFPIVYHCLARATNPLVKLKTRSLELIASERSFGLVSSADYDDCIVVCKFTQ